MLQNVQDIRWSQKLYRENHKHLKSGIDSKTEMLNWSENPKRYIPGRCTITVIICNGDDATQTHTQEMHKINKSQEKINHLMYMESIKLFTKNEKKNWKYKYTQWEYTVRT